MLQEVKLDILPTHLAIIMDGNGRWAMKHKMTREVGHQQGAEAVRSVVTLCRKIGIPVLTLYAFSMENWNRPSDEIDSLMGLLNTFLRKELKTLMDKNIRLMAMGRLSMLPSRVRRRLLSVCRLTRGNGAMVVNLAISYGGRAEIIDAVRRIAQEVSRGKLSPESLDEKGFSQYLYTAHLPDPDLLIRTGGEMRISNFLLWQTAYTEIYVTKKLWPDFCEDDLLRALRDFKRRERRFGLTSEQVSLSSTRWK